MTFMDRTNIRRSRRNSNPGPFARAGQDGFILIAAMAMLVTMLGVVLLCLYPLAYEARQAPRHREALRRLKIAEQGVFGRLADQPGGLHSACGGYFSDTGIKMVVAELVVEYESVPILRRAEEFWFFRRYTSLPPLPSSARGKDEGCEDIYRFNPESGFWVGYRGKRYVVRPTGEEHNRRDFGLSNYIEKEYPDLPFFTDGADGYLELLGTNDVTSFYLSNQTYTNLHAYRYYDRDRRPYEHRRYFNPVEKLVVRVHDRRTTRVPLSAVLVYAKQPEQEGAEYVDDYLPNRLLPPQVVTAPADSTVTIGDVTDFVFRWDHDRDDSGNDETSPPHVCKGHTFEIGLKKLVLLEGGLPVFACGIIIPPAREYQCRPFDPDPGSCTGCGQSYYDQYVVEIDYDG